MTDRPVLAHLFLEHLLKFSANCFLCLSINDKVYLTTFRHFVLDCFGLLSNSIIVPWTQRTFYPSTGVQQEVHAHMQYGKMVFDSERIGVN